MNFLSLCVEHWFITRSNYHPARHSRQTELCRHLLLFDKCVMCRGFRAQNKFKNISKNLTATNTSIIIDKPVIIDKFIVADKSSITKHETVSNDELDTNDESMKSDLQPDSDSDSVCEYLDEIISELSIDLETKLNVKDNLICEDKEIPTSGTNKKIIFAVDNDECIGSWADLSLLYVMFKIELGSEPDLDLFVDIMVKTGCIRPYVKDFFDKLIELKKKGTIYKIFMFTAASNSSGWVIYLSKVLEKWFGQSLYDGIIYKEMIEEWHIFNKSECANDLEYIKNMNMLRELIDFTDGVDSDKFHYVAIDDRPANIVNGIAIGVSAFKVAVNIMEVLRVYLPDKFEYLMEKYEKSINGSWESYLKNPRAFTNVSRDIDFLLSMEHINELFLS